jgi:hypothetical protein
MSLMQGRGGIPHIFRESVATSGWHHSFPFTCNFVIIRATSNPCKVYFSQADFDADKNYILVPVPSASTPHGEWSGPVEANGCWLKGSGGSSTVELVAFQRRG